MIRSQLGKGIRVTWRGQGHSANSSGKGILIGQTFKSYKIYVEEISFNGKISQKNLGIKTFRDLDILITDKEEILLEELFTSDYPSVREFAQQLLKMGD